MKLLNAEKKEISKIDFGTVAAGSNKSMTLIVQNDEDALVTEIKILVDKRAQDELEILSAPETLKPFEEASVVIKYTPKIELKKGLKTIINVSGTVTYGAE